MKKFLLLSCFALTACATSTTATTPATASAATNIAALGVALTAADQAALAYVTLPLCLQSTGKSASGSVLCSQATVTAQIKTAASGAYAAYKVAEASLSPTDYTTAQAALAVLSALVPAQVQ